MRRAGEQTISFDRQPALKGKLIKLRPLRLEDYPDLYAIAANPLMWEQHPDKDRHEEAVFKAFFRAAVASGGDRITASAYSTK